MQVQCGKQLADIIEKIKEKQRPKLNTIWKFL